VRYPLRSELGPIVADCRSILNCRAHDVLYPSKDRTLTLMRAGEYIKYLSDFERSIQGFDAAWRPKRFDTFPCAEIIWSTHAYLRLYVFAFAFQGTSCSWHAL
jgi:hypothetical protein